jgi:ABC-type Na+ efflux pump permease subunit
VVGLFTTVLASSALAQAADPQIGTWKLNVAKSTFDPGPAPKLGTTKIEAAGTGAKVIVDQTAADGTTRHWEFTANYDGKDIPIVGDNPDADTVARTRISATTVETISRKAGKVVATQQSTVSADGKIRTVTTKGVNAAGKTVNNVAVYERQ